MPSYIEIDKQASFPSASNAGKVIFGVNTSGNVVTVNENGTISDYSTSNISIISNTISSSVLSIDLDSSTLHKITLAGDGEIQLNNPVTGSKYTLVIKQTVGGENITWPANIVWVDNKRMLMPCLDSVRDESFNTVGLIEATGVPA
jgi:hypothetical protein